MCQINTDPMKSQTGYMEVVGKEKFSRYLLRCCYVVFSYSFRLSGFKLEQYLTQNSLLIYHRISLSICSCSFPCYLPDSL